MPRILLLALAVVAAPAFAQDVPAGADATRGRAAFMQYMCYTCHGTAGQGGDRGSGPRIAPGLWPWEGFVQQVRRPRELMPRYPLEHLPDAALADIYAYLATMKRGPKASDIPLLKGD